MKVVEFNTEAEAEVLEKAAWVQTVKNAVLAGETAYDGENEITNLDGWTDDAIAALRILGHLEGALRTDNGSTTGYANVYQVYGQNKWYITAPIDLLDLTGYSVIDLPDSWLPPDPDL